MPPLRRLALGASSLLLAALATAAAAAQGDTPFPVRQGVDIPQPYEAVSTLHTGAPDGQVQAFYKGDWPLSYSPAELHAMGFDFIRLPVNPAVLISNPPVVRARLLDQVEGGMHGFLDQHIRVIFDLHFWGPPDKVWTDLGVVSTTDRTQFERYKALVVEVATRLARYPHGQVALDLLNEPPRCDDAFWFQRQAELAQAARSVAPTLPLLMTGCNGGVDNMLRINASNTNLSDPNFLYTFHFYEPLMFTHQASKVKPFVVGVPYPARAGDLNDTLARTNAAIDAQNRAPDDAAAAKGSAKANLTKYFASNIDRSFIEHRFDQITAWAKANNIPVSRIIMGEFAAINWQTTDTPEYLKARLAWDDDVRAVADAHGIAWAYWTLPPTHGPIFR
jgi:hypothetical protein